MRRVRREDGYQYLVAPTPVQEPESAVRTMSVENEQSPVPLGLTDGLSVEQALQPAQTKLIAGPAVGRACKPARVLVRIIVLEPSVLQVAADSLVDKSWWQ